MPCRARGTSCRICSRRKYTGVIDRLAFYALPGILPDDPDALRAIVNATRA